MIRLVIYIPTVVLTTVLLGWDAGLLFLVWLAVVDCLRAIAEDKA